MIGSNYTLYMVVIYIFIVFVFSEMRVYTKRQWKLVQHKTLTNMYLNKNIILIILSHQCLTISTSRLSMERHQSEISSKSGKQSYHFFIISECQIFFPNGTKDLSD